VAAVAAAGMEPGRGLPVASVIRHRRRTPTPARRPYLSSGAWAGSDS